MEEIPPNGRSFSTSWWLARSPTPTSLTSACGSTTSTWAIDALTDLSVVIASLENTHGALMTKDSWQITLDQLFASPTDRTSLLAVAEAPSSTLSTVEQS